ncbi:unnamed protein product [Cyprideis torosa]|uniref:Uncharacterized protein n=1 Tax=Cyprideis torosa TaxID=163714 RepID=A0A7R8W8K1_9CRUS|nr:unnamed protein product [Cyprideis torosa]CAG0883544.1 unnamed protein product [Cyprideis torosa]
MDQCKDLTWDKLVSQRSNIFLFIPNLIGYMRIILAVFAILVMQLSHQLTFWAYFISALLDAVDGHAARTYNQSTKFGAMLDQLTDRCCTLALCMVLCALYPTFAFFFQFVSIIDISCHWIHLHAVAEVELGWGKGASTPLALPLPLDPDLQSSPSILSDGDTVVRVGDGDEKEESFCSPDESVSRKMETEVVGDGVPLLGWGLWPILAVMSFPVAIMKSAIALYQGYLAAVDLGAIDLEEIQGKEGKADMSQAIPDWAKGLFLAPPIYSSWEELEEVSKQGGKPSAVEVAEGDYREAMEFLIMKTQAEFIRELEAVELPAAPYKTS